MKLRIAGALAVLFAGVSSLAAQGPPPPMLGSAVPPPGAAGTLPPAPTLPPEAYYGGGEGNVFYGGADYLLWKIRGTQIPRNVSAVPVGLIAVTPTQTIDGGPPTPISDVPTYVPISLVSQANFGGPAASDPGFVNGTRITLGIWSDPSHGLGLESQTIILARGFDNRSVTNSSSPASILLDTGVSNQSYLIPALGSDAVLSGTTPITIPRNAASTVSLSTSTTLFGTEANVRSTSLRIGNTSFGSMAGFRYVAFTDRLSAVSTTTLIQPTDVAPPAVDTISRSLSFSTVDQIRVWNNFVGAQVGFDAETRFGDLVLYGRIKFAVGPNFQSAEVSGSTTVVNNDPANQIPAPRVSGGGSLVGAGDVGDHERTRYSFIPELNLKLGYQVAPWGRITVGYDGLYLGHMARAGISSTTNTLSTSIQTAGSNSSTSVVVPAFRFADHDAWVQGLSMGFELMF